MDINGTPADSLNGGTRGTDPGMNASKDLKELGIGE